MTPTPEYNLQIEELRRRSKDGKAEATHMFAELSESYLDKLRNILFLIGFALLGYLGTLPLDLNLSKLFLIGSITSGILSYFFSYLYAHKYSHYYSEVEKIFRSAFPSLSQYEEMINEEGNIRDKYAWMHRLQVFAVLLIVFQFITMLTACYLTFDIHLPSFHLRGVEFNSQ